MDLTGWGYAHIQKVAPCNGSEYRKRREEGVTYLTADRLAVAAGYHPHQVWPEMLEDDFAEFGRECEECGRRFVPGSPLRRFCGRNCQARSAARRRYESDPEHRELVRERARRYDAETAGYRRAQRRRRYRENAETERAEARRRYWEDPERARQRKQELRKGAA